MPLIIATAILTLFIGVFSLSTLSFCASLTVWSFITINFMLSALIGGILLYKAN
jgi:hypothetical protein